ncbi:MAG: MBL fold metallo-hydrolase [Actinomycetota bacterium]|nr:MBL fold metallo-hydrolase [Actinomycetota bacterium]
MLTRIWGCRGSLAAPGPETVRYGGNTSCLEVRSGDTVLVLDAGTGIRPLGLALERERPAVLHLLLTHLHLDHVEGLGFFAPIWHRETKLHVWGPPSPVRRLETRIARYLSPPLFPVHLGDIPAQMTFHDAPGDEWEIDAIRIRSAPVSHPGPTIGYRLSENGRSLTYIPDHEPVLGTELAQLSVDWLSGHELAAGSDVLLHDSQYTEDEYPGKVGWGHSSVADAVSFARRSEVGRLVLFHHDPLHADADLERLRDRAEELWGDGSRPAPALAHEGMEIEL